MEIRQWREFQEEGIREGIRAPRHTKLTYLSPTLLDTLMGGGSGGLFHSVLFCPFNCLLCSEKVEYKGRNLITDE